MKTSFKLGSFSGNFEQKAMECTTECSPETIVKSSNPAKTGSFELKDIEVTVEYDVTELPAIYKEVLPPLKEMLAAFLSHDKDIKLAKIAKKAE